MSQWTYQQASGTLIDPDGDVAGTGYSGNGDGLNNPADEAEIGVGPIPAGPWIIAEWFDTYENKGPVVARLQPDSFDPHGRSGFLIHGDNSAMNHTASDGCIILARTLREQIRDSGVTSLIVAAD